MSRSNRHGERLLLSWLDFKWATITDHQWKDVERDIGLGLSNQVRDRIKFHIDVYCTAGSFYSPENTVLVTEALPAIDAWLKAGKSLLKKLKAQKQEIQSRKSLLQNLLELLHPDRIEGLSRGLPMRLLLFAVQSAVAAGEIVRREITDESRNMPMEADLWSAWVCLMRQDLESAGLTISGASTDKTAHESPSPFIRGIVKLQSFLPKECQRYNGYEFVRKATQQSLLVMGDMEAEMLLQVLFWGMQLTGRVGYPGKMRQGPKDRIAAFEALVEDMKRDRRIHNKKFGFDPSSIFPHLRPSSET